MRLSDWRPASRLAAGRRLQARLQVAALALPPAVRGMMWMAAAGLVFTALNTIMKFMTASLPPLQLGFLRYACGLLVLLPLVMRAGLASYATHNFRGQLWRGATHTCGMLLWFSALPHIPLADNVALGFTSPIFIMLGASLVLGEKLVPARYVAAAFGFLGVAIVVAPAWTGGGGFWQLVMLGASPLFATSFLIAKMLTRRDKAEVIVVWQSLTVTVFLFPFALLDWQWPTAPEWALLLACGVIGSLGHYCSTRALRAADASATQSVKFVELIWASLAGIAVFGDYPTETTMLGGFVIFLSTTWIARREARRRA